jgi:hypothetical protein
VTWQLGRTERGQDVAGSSELDPPEAEGGLVLHDLAFVAGAVAVILLVIGTIGPPLFGRGVFLAADVSTLGYPWRAYDSPADLSTGAHGPVTDTIDATYPTRVAVANALRTGDLFQWNPYVSGGAPAASESTAGSLGPFGLFYVVLPDSFAPAAIKLAQMAVAITFTFLFGRRIGLGRCPALFAGAAFAGSGFLVMWTNWSQAEIAALIAPLFWATERYLQRPSVARATAIALVLAMMLLGKFPAVVGFALYALVAYVAGRLLVGASETTRRRLATAVGAGGSVIAGVLLVAFVLLPFAIRLGDLDLTSREQDLGSSLGLAPLVTSIAPKALGLSGHGGYFGPINQIEAISFVGMTTALLAIASLCLPRPQQTPRGVRLALGVFTGVLGIAVYGGGPVLGVLQQLPVFSDNAINRSISVLGFTVAVLAGIGFQSLSERAALPTRHRRIVVGGIIALALAITSWAGWRARDLAVDTDRLDVFTRGITLPLIIGVAALILIYLVRSTRSWTSQVATVGLVSLLVVESLVLSLPLLPNEDERRVFPTTPGIGFLADNTAHERVAPQGLNLFANATTLFGIRSATGHVFTAETWKEALETADPGVFDDSETLSKLSDEPSVITSPMLDRLGARWFAADATHVPLGTVEVGALATASCERPLLLTRPITATIPAEDGLRGVHVRSCGVVDVPRSAVLAASAEAAGTTVEGHVPLPTTVGEESMSVALPADDLAGDGDITLTLTMSASEGRALALATTEAGTVALEPIRPEDDGLRLRYAGDMRIYERMAALPRIRWSGSAMVVEEPAERLRLLGDGLVPDDTTVLSEPNLAGSGADGTADVVLDAPTAITVEVDAEGDGYLVVSDALQTDWVATIDGERVDLIAADHAGVAVAVPSGHHTVNIRYEPRGQRAGLAISGLSALGIVAALVGERMLHARRSRR